MSEVKNVKIVCIGDGAVGKTCMLICYAKNTFPEDYVPTVFDNFQTTEMYDNKAYNMGLWDTAGQEDYDRLRPMSYPDTNVVLCCFSLVESTSLDNIEIKWVPEVNQYLEATVPIILVGTKLDLREDGEFMRELEENGKSGVTKEEGQRMSTKIGATYRECSAKTGDGLKEVFQEAIRVVLEPPPARKLKNKGKKGKKKKDGGGGGCQIL